MQAILQSKGLFSLPSNPKIKIKSFISQLSRDLRYKFNPINSFSKSITLHKTSPSPNGFSNIQSKPQLVVQNNRNHHLCRAEAAASSADGQPLFGEREPSKFLGLESVILKKIIPLGLMFFCICSITRS